MKGKILQTTDIIRAEEASTNSTELSIWGNLIDCVP